MSENVEAVYGLTPMQEGMLFHKMMNEKDSSYHIQNAFWMDHEVDQEIINQVLSLLVRKHEIFRTGFLIPKATGTPRQVLLKNRELQLISYDATGEDEAEVISRFEKKDLERGFNLKTDSLIRLYILSFGEKHHYFIFSFHHIIMDGWCMSLVLDDFFQFYEDLEHGKSYEELKMKAQSDARKECTYRDYIKWLEQKNQEEDLSYWKDLLTDYNEKAEILSVTEPVVTDKQVDIVTKTLTNSLTRELVALSNSNKITMSTVAETVWGILLQKYGYSADVVYGKVISGRNVPLKGVENKVGLFINSIPVRVTVSEKMTFNDLAKTVYRQDIESSQYENCALAEIQRISGAGSDLIKTMFVFENYYAGEDEKKGYLDNYHISFAKGREQTNYDLSISFSLADEQLLFTLMYRPSCYKEEQIETIAQSIINIFQCVVDNPEVYVQDIEFLTESDKDKILNQFNATVEPMSQETIVDVWEKEVYRHPDKVALAYNGTRISYENMNQKINVLAHRLINMGVKKGDYVAIFSGRHLETVYSIYAVIKAGGAYVPIDPKYPKDRIQYMLSDCKPKLILKDHSELESNIPSIDILEEELWIGNVQNPRVQLTPNDLAYCIYTSGTTGRPKGVMVEHKGVVNLRKYFIESIGITREDSILQFANIVFDASVWEMTMGLLTGAKLVVPTEKEQKNNRDFLEMVEREQVSVATLPPIFYLTLEGFQPRILITAGSESSPDIARKGSEHGEYINAYGPTETTVCATHWLYDRQKPIPSRISIGTPILNTNIYILSNHTLCGIGMPGELCIAGTGIARGYLNREELTSQKFIPNPYGEGMLYRSGDLARWLPDGTIDYMGRIDEQVKIRGFRIELGEVDYCIRKVEGVQAVAVIAKKDKFGDMALFAYVVASDEVTIQKIREETATMVPEYMLPSYWMKLDEIPVTRNGKLDKKALPEIVIDSKIEYVPPKNHTEKMLCDMFCTILKKEKIGITDSFFELGGDSIKAMKLVTLIRGQGYEFAISEAMKLETVQNIAAALEKEVFKDAQTIDNSNLVKLTEYKEIMNYLQDNNEQLIASVIRNKPEYQYDAAPIQTFLYHKHILNSGISLSFTHEVDVDKLSKALCELANTHQLLRSALKQDGQRLKISVYSAVEEFVLPAVDLSEAEDAVKQQVEKELQRQYQDISWWSDEKLFRKLLYRIYLLKYKENDWKLYVPFCHLGFDGMSADILRSKIQKMYYSKDCEKENNACSYGDYVDFQEPDEKLEDDRMVSMFELEKFHSDMEMISKEDGEQFSNILYTVKSELLETMEQSNLWEIGYHLFYKMASYSYQMEKIPVGILMEDRISENGNYYDEIGLYLDLIPLEADKASSFDFERLQAIMEMKKANNIHFAGFLYDEKILRKYPKMSYSISMLRDYDMPVYNYLGLFTDILEIENLKENYKSYQKTLNVDVSFCKDSVVICGFGKEEESGKIQQLLQKDLESYITSKIGRND